MTKVLVAEDDQLLSTILEKTLALSGFEVHTAKDGFEAEIDAKNWRPDVMLLDLMMPNEDGFGVLRFVRADSDLRTTKIIVLSNLSGDEIIAKVKKFGVTDYLIKAHTTPDEIIQKIKTSISLPSQ